MILDLQNARNNQEGGMYVVNSKLLKNKMAEENITQDYLADKLKLSQPTLSLKLNNNRSFTIEEMFSVVEILNIEPREIRDFFWLRLAKRKKKEKRCLWKKY